MPGRGRCVARSARRPSSSRRCGAYVGSITTGGRYRRRGSSGNSSTGWRSARPRQRTSWRPTQRSGTPCSSGRIRCRPDAPGAGDRPHRPGGAASSGRSAMAMAPGVVVPGRCSQHAVVPGLSGAGPAAESGGPGPGPGAGPSPESGDSPALCGLAASPPSGSRLRSRRRPTPS